MLNRKELDREATRVKGEMSRRWDDIKRLEEQGEAPTMEDDTVEDNVEEDDNEELDADRTLVEEPNTLETPAKSFSTMSVSSLKRPSPAHMMSTFSAGTRSSTPVPPMHTLNLGPSEIHDYFVSRFTAIQQQTCKLVVKAWIKVIEPKKQMKFPYNKGEELKPVWWPEGVRHREPDHLHKDERKKLLACIVRSPLVSVSRLELSTAEAAAFISPAKLAILREVYLVAKEEERKRQMGDTATELIVHLPNVPVSPSAVSPDGEKRSHQFISEDKENVDVNQPAKRYKHANRLPALVTSTNYDVNYAPHSPFTYAPQPNLTNVWREPPSHLSPYPQSGSEMAWSDYSRSPNPEAVVDHQARYGNHLAPILNHHTHASPSPIDSPAFPHSASMQQAPAQGQAQGYYPRTQAGQSYMQQQQMDYLHQHAHQTQYDYGSPYIADNSWSDSPFNTQAAQ